MDADARRAATTVLERNRRGDSTVPAAGLYPHQWSWDSAFIAFGLRHLDPGRAQSELTSLLDAHWADGRVPQIVFASEDDAGYSPGPTFWRRAVLPGSPAQPTSGLVQPPLHAWAALAVHRADPAASRRSGFLDRAYPALVAWHRYLAERRDRGGLGLVAAVHPWETGMDNSPAWDLPLARVPSDPPADVAGVPRPDLVHAGAAERPTDEDYGRYLHLAGRYRDSGCDDLDAGHPFLVEDPGTNALWAVSELALGTCAAELGGDPAPHRERAAGTTGALEALYDPALGTYRARDVRTGELLGGASCSGLLALLLPGAPHPATLLDLLAGPRFALGSAVLVPSYDLTAPDADLARYWRGPSWTNTAWLLVQALRAHGRDEQAAALAGRTVELAVEHDFPEYLHPWTGAPYGTRQFSWTAALALDLLAGDTATLPGS